MKFAELTQEVLVARSQQVCFDGLAPGRRRINQQYKEAAMKAEENGKCLGDYVYSLNLIVRVIFSLHELSPLLAGIKYMLSF